MTDDQRAEPQSGALFGAPTRVRAGVPPVVPGFEVVRWLGGGGDGDVWLAEQMRPIARLVALKVFRARHDGDAVVRRFRAEREALARLPSAGFCAVHDAGITGDGRPYLVLEFVDGPTLLAACAELGDRPGTMVLLLERLARTLGAAHRLGILHLDLKPSNVLVAGWPGEDCEPRIIDFGMARSFGSVALGSGTLGFTAPEVLEGGAATPRSDVYSLGRIITAAVESAPSVVNSEQGVRAMAVAAECVWRDPARRPATAVEVADMLRLAGVPRRGRAALVAPALLVVAVAVAVAVAVLALVARGPAIRHAPGGAEPAPASRALLAQASVQASGGLPWVRIADSESDFGAASSVSGWRHLLVDRAGSGLTPLDRVLRDPRAEGFAIDDLALVAGGEGHSGGPRCAVFRSGFAFLGPPGGVAVVRRFVVPGTGRYRVSFDAPAEVHGRPVSSAPSKVVARVAGVELPWRGELGASITVFCRTGEALDLCVDAPASGGAVLSPRMSIEIASCMGVADGEPVQWPVASGGNGHWYARFDAPRIWEDARTWCESLGATLVTLSSRTENDFVLHALCLGPVAYAIGGVQQPASSEPSAGWQWVTGEPWGFENWLPGEPNHLNGDFGEDETVLWGTTGGWNDIGRGGGNPCICEWHAESRPDPHPVAP